MDTYKEEKEGAGVLAFLEMSFEISGKMSTNPRKKSNFPSLSVEFERHFLEKKSGFSFHRFADSVRFPKKRFSELGKKFAQIGENLAQLGQKSQLGCFSVRSKK